MINTTPGEVSPSDQSRASLEERPIIRLSESRVERAHRIADRRNASYESIGGGRVCGDQTSKQAHLVGVIGEIACAVFLGIDIDDKTWVRGDPGYDLIYGGSTIDVKSSQTTAVEHPDLIVPVNPTPTADIYLQTHWTGDRAVRLLGYSHQQEVLHRSPVRAPGTDLNYIVPPDALKPPQLLLEQGDGIESFGEAKG